MSCGFTIVQGEARLALVHNDKTGPTDPGFGFPDPGSSVTLTRPNGTTQALTHDIWLPDVITVAISPTLPAGDYTITVSIGGVSPCSDAQQLRIGSQPVSDLALARADPIAVAPGATVTLRHPSPAFVWTESIHAPVELRDKDDKAVTGFKVESGWGTGALVVRVPAEYRPPAPAHTISFAGSPHRVGVAVVGAAPVPDPTDVPGAKLGVRLLATGFKVEKETWDHALEVDGKRDEVQLRAEVVEVDLKTGGTIEHRSVRSKVFGDTNSFPNRVQAGSASDKGGLKTGNQHGETKFGGGAVHNDDLPLRIWEGTLTAAGTALLVVPTIWEIDDNPDPHLIQPAWSPTLTGLVDQVRATIDSVRERLALPKLPDALLDPPAAAARLGASEPFATVGSEVVGISRQKTGFVGHSGDRPIGMRDVGGDRHACVPFVLLLTFETAFLIAQTGAADLPFFSDTGAFELRYIDAEEIGGGDYRLFLHLTKTG